MRVLGVRLARSIWLIPQHFLNPKGLFVRPIAYALKERYQFLNTPIEHQNQPSQPSQDGWKFENGAFATQSGTIQIVAMVIHTEGLLVDTRSSTEDGDAFLQDAITFASKEFGLPTAAELLVRRMYVSEINVHYPKRPQLFDPRLDKLAKEIQATFGNEAVGGVDTLSLQIGNDTTASPRPSVFRIDREINTPIEANRFWSQAPLQTHKHMRLLQMIEDLT